MHTNARFTLIGLTIFGLTALLTACGGGGGSSTVASLFSFPLQSGFNKLIANGQPTKNFTVSGDCTGSGSNTVSPASTSATFEQQVALSSTRTFIMSLIGCNPASTAQTTINYYSTNYVPLGFDSVGVNYGVYLSPPSIPSSVKVGDTGIIGTVTLYTDSTKATDNGKVDQSYVIEADTSITAIVNILSKLYDAGGTLNATEQDRYRMDSLGNLTPISIDIQYANTSTNHLVLTF